MVDTESFVNYLCDKGISFYSGVPDSLLKNFCACISSKKGVRNIIAANEGGAIGLVAGHHLATGKIPLVYMQNSGEGNAVNPLLSLMDADVYNMPVLLLIGWRGEPGIHDEPQHVKQGKVTLSLLDTMGIKYEILEDEDNKVKSQIDKAIAHMQATNEPYALVVRKGTFAPFEMPKADNGLRMSRENAIKTVIETLGEDDIVVSTTGMISRELFELREARGEDHKKDFLTVGSMGHASQIALGIALEKPSRKVYCFDGDGAMLMHLGGIAIIGDMAPKNYRHILFNNGAHDSVGGQRTVGLSVDFCKIALASGYKKAISVDNEEDLRKALLEIDEGPILIEAKVRKGNRKDLGRPTIPPRENKKNYMEFIKGNSIS